METNLDDITLEQLLNSDDSIDLVYWIRNDSVRTDIYAILNKEGEQLTNDPNDSGGLTKWGCTEKTARSLGYDGDMADLTFEKAALIGAWEFYYRPRINVLNNLVGDQFAYEAFDAAYLMGSGGVVKCIQRFLNAMNRNERDWRDISTDGVIGFGETVPAIKAAVKRRGSAMMLRHLRGTLYAFMLELVERREKDEEWFNGWVEKRIGGSEVK